MINYFCTECYYIFPACDVRLSGVRYTSYQRKTYIAQWKDVVISRIKNLSIKQETR